MHIRTVGICPGSGSSVILSRDRSNIPDLVFTGELGHHDALSVIERGSAVVALSHSNTERGYLHAVMRDKLVHTLRQEWGQVNGGIDVSDVHVEASELDRDPYGIMVRQA